LRFIELCCGLGGLRHGLELAGWTCGFSADKDPRAIALHRTIFGDGEVVELENLRAEDLPSYDVLVAGFPCQPFSTSGDKKGFTHSSGNVFLEIMRLVGDTLPPYLLFENVEGILRNQKGYSMASVLRLLNDLGYEVSWVTLDACLMNACQTRRRVFFICALRGTPSDSSDDRGLPEILRCLVEKLSAVFKISLGPPDNFDLKNAVQSTEPQIGKPNSEMNNPFKAWGLSGVQGASSGRIKYSIPNRAVELGEICCPQFSNAQKVKSVRYYARGGPTKPHLRKESIAHCLGTNIGAAPTFALPTKLIETPSDLEAILQFSNWHRYEEEHLVFRINPARAALLFGHEGRMFSDILAQSGYGSTYQYIALGNLVAPAVAKQVGLTMAELFS
jgi:DNA-cytosine methyltransferase